MPTIADRILLNKRFRLAALIVGLLSISLGMHACAMQYQLRREIAETERDPVTGVIRGAEALTLKPASYQHADPDTQRIACLMIHGFLSSRTDFANVPRMLVDRGIAVRLMRLPGHGTTPADFAHNPPGALYRAVRAEYRRLADEYDRVYVAGFSMGGSLATILASEYPVDRLVLIAPYYDVAYKWYYILPVRYWARVLSVFVPYVRKSDNFIRLNDRSQVENIISYHMTPSAGVRQLMRVGARARDPETLRKVSCPTLVLQSRNDEASNPNATLRAYDRLGSREKQLVWFHRSNHILLWDYDREEARERIVRFLTRPGCD